MVAVDDDRKPASVPPLEPSTPEEQRRFEEAKGRKAARLELERRHAERAAARG
jgi:acyl-CoA hydrolase